MGSMFNLRPFGMESYETYIFDLNPKHFEFIKSLI